MGLRNDWHIHNNIHSTNNFGSVHGLYDLERREGENEMMQKLTKNIKQWAIDRGLDKAEPHKQMLKLIEEVGEIAAGLARGNMDEVKDGIGDTQVVLTILDEQLKNYVRVDIEESHIQMLELMVSVGEVALSVLNDNTKATHRWASFARSDVKQLAVSVGSDIEECTQLAWNEIKDRKGRLIDGVFVKESDLV